MLPLLAPAALRSRMGPRGYRYLIESRHFDEAGRLSEPIVWRQLLEDTGGA